MFLIPIVYRLVASQINRGKFGHKSNSSRSGKFNFSSELIFILWNEVIVLLY